MLTELLMQDERKAGRVEECKGFILEFLSEIGNVSEEIRWKVMQENDLSKLRAWTKLAARVDSVEQFMEMM